MFELQKEGAANINLVTPTIWFQQIKKAIILARQQGFKIPIVWNSNGYEAIELLKQLEGLIDIYLPDFKYGDDQIALKYSGAKNYTQIAASAIQEMLRQVGYLKECHGLAVKGLIVRHLILPHNLENSFKALDILSSIDKKIHLSLMSQYYPLYKVREFPEINQLLPRQDFLRACNYALKLGFSSGWIQEKGCCKELIPDFTQEKPFISLTKL